MTGREKRIDEVDRGGRTDAGNGERLTMSVVEAARLLGISKSAAYDCVRTGDLPAIKMGRRWLVPIAALHRLLDSAA
ncbi:MAG: helix-turn-helix domain-containing protein [Actinomycetota bacterium]